MTTRSKNHLTTFSPRTEVVGSIPYEWVDSTSDGVRWFTERILTGDAMLVKHTKSSEESKIDNSPIDDDEDTLSEIDLITIKWIDETKIRELLNNKYKIDIDTTKWLNRMNYLLSESIRFYNQYLYKNIPPKIQKTQFRGASDVINFFKATYEDSQYWFVYCNLLKIWLALNHIHWNELLDWLEEKTADFMSNILIPRLQIHNSNFVSVTNTNREKNTFEFYDTQGLYTREFPSESWLWVKTIKFYLRCRWKNRDSVTAKLLGNPKLKIEDIIRDGIAWEFMVQKKEDAIWMLEFIFLEIFNKNSAEFRQKNMFDAEELDSILKDMWEYTNWINSEFLRVLKWMKNKKKPKWNIIYSDAKGQWTVTYKNKKQQVISAHWEFRIVLEWNKNEKGMAHHSILDGLKKVYIMARLQWYITEWYIKRVIEQMFPESSEERKTNILQYYIANLYKIVTSPWTSAHIFTTHWRWKTLSWTPIFPTTFVSARAPWKFNPVTNRAANDAIVERSIPRKNGLH